MAQSVTKYAAFFLSLLVLAGCAARQGTYIGTPESRQRILGVFHEVDSCVQPGKPITVHLVEDPRPCAWVDDRGDPAQLHVCDGLIYRDDAFLYFALSHEMAHVKLGHTRKAQAASYATTAGFVVLGVLVPGAGLLNHAVNPAIIGAYSREAELDADRLAAEKARECFGVPLADIVQVLEQLQREAPDGGGFWDRHPAWTERIENIKGISPGGPAEKERAGME